MGTSKPVEADVVVVVVFDVVEVVEVDDDVDDVVAKVFAPWCVESNRSITMDAYRLLSC